MIPELPREISDSAMLEFYDQIATNLENQSTHHVSWFSHKRNPSVCWICDQQILMRKLIDILGGFITKSSVDIETAFDQEDEAISESDEEFANVDEEVASRTPEYEVIEDER